LCYLDTAQPLKTIHQEDNYVILPSQYASPAVVDVTDNLRAKIYSLFSKLGEWIRAQCVFKITHICLTIKI